MITVERKLSIKFEFEDEELDCNELDLLNEVLADYELEELSFRKGRGYLHKEYSPEGAITKKHYGVVTGEVICTEAKPGEGDRFKLMSETFDIADAPDSDTYHDIWCEKYPDQAMRLLQLYEFKDVRMFLVAYHQRLA